MSCSYLCEEMIFCKFYSLRLIHLSKINGKNFDGIQFGKRTDVN